MPIDNLNNETQKALQDLYKELLNITQDRGGLSTELKLALQRAEDYLLAAQYQKVELMNKMNAYQTVVLPTNDKEVFLDPTYGVGLDTVLRKVSNLNQELRNESEATNRAKFVVPSNKIGSKDKDSLENVNARELINAINSKLDDVARLVADAKQTMSPRKATPTNDPSPSLPRPGKLSGSSE